jgi:hypothetical protein
VLVVHGRGFKPPADALADISFAALRAGVQRDYPEHLHLYDETSVNLVYYGDLSNELLRGRNKDYDHQIDIGDRSNALAQLRNINVRKKFGIRQYDLRPGKSALPEFCANFVAPLCGMLGLTKALLSRLSPDFAEYLVAESEYAKECRNRFRKALCERLDRDERIMVVSHGTGSVIVYDVLWQLSHDARFTEDYGDHKIDTWLTLGAPLGDNYIRKHLLAAKERDVSYPKNVINWLNVSAEDDYVCHDNTLADDFKDMLAQKAVSSVQDYRVYNLAVRYGKSNPHSSVGYFIHPRVSKILADWVRTPVIPSDPELTI